MATPSPLDHALVALVTVGLPLHVLLFWFPRVKRAVRVHARGARHRAYLEGNVILWSITALVFLHWNRAGRPLGDLGLGLPHGPRFWLTLGAALGIVTFLLWQRVTLLKEVGAADVRGALLRHLEPVRPLLPHTPGELAHFGVVSLTAGVCEEVLFRGFVLAYLQALVPGLAALFVSALLFGMAHAYQGNRGVLQTGIVGLVLGAFAVAGGSLWVPMLLHAMVDMNSGLTAYAILREPPTG